MRDFACAVVEVGGSEKRILSTDTWAEVPQSGPKLAQELQAADKVALQGYGRPYDVTGKPTGSYYAYAKDPQDIPDWSCAQVRDRVQEAMTKIATQASHMENAERLKAIFKRWDLQSTGFIMKKDLSDIFKHLDSGCTDDELKDMYEATGVDTDECINYERFIDRVLFSVT